VSRIVVDGVDCGGTDKISCPRNVTSHEYVEIAPAVPGVDCDPSRVNVCPCTTEDGATITDVGPVVVEICGITTERAVDHADTFPALSVARTK
jgi:hypothetical protein